jgi:membrane carboxypeptidase/penicillin-binding protein PbpC
MDTSYALFYRIFVPLWRACSRERAAALIVEAGSTLSMQQARLDHGFAGVHNQNKTDLQTKGG